jgi:hypothetical protein
MQLEVARLQLVYSCIQLLGWVIMFFMKGDDLSVW